MRVVRALGAILFLITGLSLGLSAQISDPFFLVNELPAEVEETSGLIFYNGELWTHNDSGNPSKIYSIDTVTGEILRTKTIRNAENVDWEDIAIDATHLYIGDFGNNINGSFESFKIYRLKLEDLLSTENDTIDPRIINFTYSSDIYPEEGASSNNTHFDCEAMIAKDDTIFLFSKNWIDKTTTFLYAIPNKANYFHTISPIDTLEVGYLVTGADYDYVSNTVALIGYNYDASTIPDSKPYISLLKNFSGNKFFSGTCSTMMFSSPNSITNQSGGITHNQTEGICFRDPSRLWVSNEMFTKTVAVLTITIPPHLREFQITDYDTVNQPGTQPIYPEEPMPIEIRIESDDSIILEGSTINFSDMSSNEPTSWHWVFEGGEPSISTERNPQVTYSTPGIYSVSLTAENESSTASVTFENFVTVYGYVTADFTSDITSVEEGNVVNFRSISENATSLEWTFEGAVMNTSIEQNPIVTYNEQGSFSVSLTASNPLDSDNLTVANYIVVSDIKNIEIEDLCIYPNPVKDILTINAYDNRVVSFKIFNELGNVVLGSDKKKCTDSIDISSLSAGFYTISLNINGSEQKIKFIKL